MQIPYSTQNVRERSTKWPTLVARNCADGREMHRGQCKERKHRRTGNYSRTFTIFNDEKAQQTWPCTPANLAKCVNTRGREILDAGKRAWATEKVRCQRSSPSRSRVCGQRRCRACMAWIMPAIACITATCTSLAPASAAVIAHILSPCMHAERGQSQGHGCVSACAGKPLWCLPHASLGSCRPSLASQPPAPRLRWPQRPYCAMFNPCMHAQFEHACSKPSITSSAGPSPHSTHVHSPPTSHLPW
jgi:hypothetical protein